MRVDNQQDIIEINSHLSSFTLLDTITSINEHTITAEKTFSGHDIHFITEALFQLCAIHCRYIIDFSRHAFLLKIQQMSMPFEPPTGLYQFSAVSTCNSSLTYEYLFSACTAESATEKIISGSCLVATRDYDDIFQQELLETHYKKVFACLNNS